MFWESVGQVILVFFVLLIVLPVLVIGGSIVTAFWVWLNGSIGPS